MLGSMPNKAESICEWMATVRCPLYSDKPRKRQKIKSQKNISTRNQIVARRDQWQAHAPGISGALHRPSTWAGPCCQARRPVRSGLACGPGIAILSAGPGCRLTPCLACRSAWKRSHACEAAASGRRGRHPQSSPRASAAPSPACGRRVCVGGGGEDAEGTWPSRDFGAWDHRER